MSYQRGDIVTCAPPGDLGKPRPAIVLQSDLFNETHSSVTLCPLTTHPVNAPLFRISLNPNKLNGLKKTSQAMTDKLTTLRSDRVGDVIGKLGSTDFGRIETAVKLWLGFETP